MEMEPVTSSSRAHDVKSVSSESTTLRSSLPPLPSTSPLNRPKAPPARNVGGATPELPPAALCKWFTAICFAFWCASIAVCFIQYFRVVNTGASHWELGYLLAWIACSSVFIIFILIFVVSVLMRNPSKSYVDTLRRLAIFLTVISALIAVGAFPILGGCTENQCSGKEGDIRTGLGACIGGGTLWAISWVFTIHELWQRL
ncbi:hypothetical protein MSAN_00844200 [Mycena sanguinolenta]|uniref:MARVEL domain-containing protein n=1 Tax=Mycena sanguinolenta TaxID=230812 RepID=A0A8H6YVD3_9AGAR|nr:hypothetical protein MSAN_00844200 [Mycena sanguinolenta]